jgi:hypothetical protein
MVVALLHRGVAIIDIASDVAIGKTIPTKLDFNSKTKIF